MKGGEFEMGDINVIFFFFCDRCFVLFRGFCSCIGFSGDKLKLSLLVLF